MKRTGRTLVCAGLLTLALAASGCSSLNQREIQIDQPSGLYQRATLSYRMDGTRWRTAAHGHGSETQQVSFQEVIRSPFPDGSVGSLSIQYPHPDGRAGYALAEVVIHAGAAPQSRPPVEAKGWLGAFSRMTRDHLPGVKWGESVHEAWALDVPKSELDQILAHLAASGYFQHPGDPNSAVQLVTSIDGAHLDKSWQRQPQVEALMARVRSEGKLASHTLPPPTAPTSAPAPAGQLAYRDLILRQQRQPGDLPAQATIASSPPAQPWPAQGKNPGAPIAAHPPAGEITRLPAVTDSVMRR